MPMLEVKPCNDLRLPQQLGKNWAGEERGEARLGEKWQDTSTRQQERWRVPGNISRSPNPGLCPLHGTT